MKVSNKGFDQCGNAQTVVNDSQVIVSAEVTDQANDVRQVEPMVENALINMESAGVRNFINVFTADAGYFSEDNMHYLDDHPKIGVAYVATGRLKHHESVPAAPQGRPPKDQTPKDQTPKQQMARRLRTEKGKAEYARRKAIAEPPFGQIKHCRGFRQFSMRGLAKMNGEWKLVCLTHNLLKLFRSEVPAFA